ncbi:hypothetical protein BH20VER2_BH20VER2_19090 [soil metagenome]
MMIAEWSGLLSLGERMEVRGCLAPSHKPAISENAQPQQSGCCGTSCETGSFMVTSSAASTHSAVASSTSSVSKLAWPLSLMDRGMAMKPARLQMQSERQSYWRMECGSFASGILRCSLTPAGSLKQFCLSLIRRTHAGVCLIAPHLNPLPEGEEEDCAESVRSSAGARSSGAGYRPLGARLVFFFSSQAALRSLVVIRQGSRAS